MTISRIGLKQSVLERDVNDIKWNANWFVLDSRPGAQKTRSIIYSTDDEQTSIQYVKENLINLSYMIVKGKERQEIFKYICDSLDIFGREEIQKVLKNELYFEENSTHYLEAIYHLGIIATPDRYDEELFTLFEKVLFHSDAEVRNTGITALHFTGWKQFKEPLEQIQATDSNSGIRKFAASALNALGEKNWNEVVRPPRLYFEKPKKCIGFYASLNKKIQKIKIFEVQYIEDSDLMEAVKNVIRKEPIPEQLKKYEAEIIELASIIGGIALSRGKTIVIYSGMLASLIGKGKMTFEEAFDCNENRIRFKGGMYPPSQQGETRAMFKISKALGFDTSKKCNSEESLAVVQEQYQRQKKFYQRYLEMLLEEKGINMEDPIAIKEFQENEYENSLKKSIKQFYGIDYFAE